MRFINVRGVCPQRYTATSNAAAFSFSPSILPINFCHYLKNDNEVVNNIRTLMDEMCHELLNLTLVSIMKNITSL